MIFASSAIDKYLPLIIIGGLLAFFGLLIIIVIILKRHVSFLQIKKDEISEEEAVQQELDRVLVPVEDEMIEKKEKDDTKENE